MSRTLVLTQCHLKTHEQGRLLAVNLKLVQRLNPCFDILLIDNASPVDPIYFLPARTVERYETWLEDSAPNLEHSLELRRFRHSIGHFSHKFLDERDPSTAKDGPGRAIMTGLRIAMNSGFDRLAYVEDDAFFALPLEEGFRRMTHPVACLPRGKHGYLDQNIFWVKDLKWLEKFDYIGRYDWPTQRQGPGREGERVFEAILGNHLQVLPFKGGRGEGYTTADNLAAVYPSGCDWLTHVDRKCYAQFLRMNGFPDLAGKLLGV